MSTKRSRRRSSRLPASSSDQRRRAVEVLELTSGDGSATARRPKRAVGGQDQRRRIVDVLGLEDHGSRQPVVRRSRVSAASDAILIYGYISAFGEDAVSVERVMAELDALEGTPEISVRINSPGGDVFEALAIYNAIARFSGHVVVHVDGLAASAASLVALAGDEIRIAENAMFMVHRPWTIALGDAEELRTTARMLDKVWAAMLTTYVSEAELRAPAIEQRIVDGGGEWWLAADEAIRTGFADAIEERSNTSEAATASARSSRSRSRGRTAPHRAAAAATNVPRTVREQLRAYRFAVEGAGCAVRCSDCDRVLVQATEDGMLVAALSGSALRRWHAGECRR